MGKRLSLRQQRRQNLSEPDGPFGTELHGTLPADGGGGPVPVRFIGVDGPFGPELRAQVPVVSDGTGVTDGARPARFIGVDGPRWFLRGLLAGPVAADGGKAAVFEEALRGCVVVRGTDPLPVREPVPLRLPSDITLPEPDGELG